MSICPSSLERSSEAVGVSSPYVSLNRSWTYKWQRVKPRQAKQARELGVRVIGGLRKHRPGAGRSHPDQRCM
jgi:hypothetical protein